MRERLSAEGSVMLDDLRDDILDFMDWLEQEGLQQEGDGVDAWLGRGEVLVVMFERQHALTLKVREFRRAYGHEVDPAELNRFDLPLDQAAALLAPLLRTVLRGVAKAVYAVESE